MCVKFILIFFLSSIVVVRRCFFYFCCRLLTTTTKVGLVSAMNKTMLCLDNDMLMDDFFEDTRLLGIVASPKSYRFCWYINHSLSYEFRLNPEIEVHLRRRNRNYYFNVYEHTVLNCFVSHYLYQNYFDGEYLLPEFKHIDFVWLIKNESSDANRCSELIATVKKLNGVQLVTELPDEKIKNKKHLIF